MVVNGRSVRNPATEVFIPESHDTKLIIIADIITLTKAISIGTLPKGVSDIYHHRGRELMIYLRL